MRPLRSLAALAGLVPEIVTVMCGARAETQNRLVATLPNAHFIGFEPDAAACELLRRSAPAHHSYCPVAVGAREETRPLYITREPACSSLLPPNRDFFGQFLDCGSQIEVVEERPVQTVSLNNYLPQVGVTTVDFLELDTQGTELDILLGADRWLASTVVGVKAEVEFSPIYQGQPLFSQVDEYLRSFGFIVFDLSRSRYRRSTMPRTLRTRGQLLWGDALYLRDYRQLASPEQLLKLCALSAALGFHDYAVEILDPVLSTASETQRARLANFRRDYLAELCKRSFGLRAARLLHKLRIKAARRWSRQTDFSWED